MLHSFGDPENLALEDVPGPPPPGAGEVLVRIAAAGVNPADWKLASGAHPQLVPGFPYIVGRDFAGVIQSVGVDVRGFTPGERVFGFAELHWPGTWAEYITIPTDWIALAPERSSMVEAASLPTVAMTAWNALFEDLQLRQGQILLVSPAAGGVGSAAVQMAKAAKAYVIGATSTKNIAYLQGLGCDETIDYTQRSVDATTLKDIDAVFEGVGGKNLRDAYRMVRKGGGVVSMSEPPDEAAAKSLGIKVFRGRGRPAPGLLRRIALLVDSGALRAQVTKVYPIAEAPRALAEVKIGHTRGKVVLTVSA